MGSPDPEKHPKFAHVIDRVNYVAMLMTSGEYRTGTTVRELARCWGVSESLARQIGIEAGRHLKLAIDSDAIVRGFIEARSGVLRNAAKAEDEGQYDVAGRLYAASEASSVQLMGHVLGSSKHDAASTHKMLIEAGWRPPASLTGLPAPRVMGPADVTPEGKDDCRDSNEKTENACDVVEHVNQDTEKNEVRK